MLSTKYFFDVPYTVVDSINRKIQNLGFVTDHKSKTEIEKRLRNIFDLSFFEFN